ncbi:hypothetical protein M409DRAFT_65053 [Zasmidium cellare ATCC 36951]|uniref:NmrA-like domain-containing protein n=1 Tax=Zasmidium cellare ATCC 36951 TaxID=1080233 RepID=A0A6A6CT57_ZASCE|nr:uncharacterized protein M409DRAFT_65053 [Zasmidium cellare ATCC 36951]KAF2169368.1 hypothetical protein M409DRAFT_65053 [Zasmidium cellare ATCC 36951]
MSSSPKIRVGIVGASGETGTSIINGLLEAGKFDLIALTRPASMTKPINLTLQSQGVTLRPRDLTSPQPTLVAALSDIEILISSVPPMDLLSQLPLITAAKTAGVRRFLPCAYAPVIPPGGVHIIIDEKEKVYQAMKQARLPFTVVDIGWWYQLCVPRVPSGRTDGYQLTGEGNTIVGDGAMPSALTDLRDVGRYVARIVVDERTVNRYVFVWNEVWSQREIFGAVERVLGEEVERKFVGEEELREKLEGMGDAIDLPTIATKVPVQYHLSLYIRGDNQPENAEYLGYLLGKDLYPDFEARSFDAYLKEVMDGTAKEIYKGRYEDLKKMFRK